MSYDIIYISNNSKYQYQPSLPSASYIESDFGTKGGHTVGGTKQTVYNSGYSKKSNHSKSSTFGNIEEYKKRNGIEDFNCLYANKFN